MAHCWLWEGMDNDRSKTSGHKQGAKSPSQNHEADAKMSGPPLNDCHHDKHASKSPAPNTPEQKDKKTLREEKLAAALRDNLRRRKTPNTSNPASSDPVTSSPASSSTVTPNKDETS